MGLSSKGRVLTAVSLRVPRCKGGGGGGPGAQGKGRTSEEEQRERVTGRLRNGRLELSSGEMEARQGRDIGAEGVRDTLELR